MPRRSTCATTGESEFDAEIREAVWYCSQLDSRREMWPLQKGNINKVIPEWKNSQYDYETRMNDSQG
jgi:hypothetical protein